MDGNTTVPGNPGKKKNITTLILLLVLIVGLVGIYLLLSKNKIGMGGKTPVPTASQGNEKVFYGDK